LVNAEGGTRTPDLRVSRAQSSPCGSSLMPMSAAL